MTSAEIASWVYCWPQPLLRLIWFILIGGSDPCNKPDRLVAKIKELFDSLTAQPFSSPPYCFLSNDHILWGSYPHLILTSEMYIHEGRQIKNSTEEPKPVIRQKYTSPVLPPRCIVAGEEELEVRVIYIQKAKPFVSGLQQRVCLLLLMLPIGSPNGALELIWC